MTTQPYPAATNLGYWDDLESSYASNPSDRALWAVCCTNGSCHRYFRLACSRYIFLGGVICPYCEDTGVLYVTWSGDDALLPIWRADYLRQDGRTRLAGQPEDYEEVV